MANTRGYIHGGGYGDEEALLPHIKQKAIRPEVWDATGHLSGRGAHMPVLFYVGDRSRRSEQRLVEREIHMIDYLLHVSVARRQHVRTTHEQHVRATKYQVGTTREDNK